MAVLPNWDRDSDAVNPMDFVTDGMVCAVDERGFVVFVDVGDAFKKAI